MGLSDITGVFSRYFVVGFFLPAYIALVSLWLTASSAFIPNSLEQHSQGSQILILGAVALVGALALSGLSYYIIRVLEGYPLERARSWFFFRTWYRGAMWLQRRRYDQLTNKRDDQKRTPGERGNAMWCLDKWFPKDSQKLLPTRLGNAIRAFEQHANTRWGLDGVTIWPRIEAMLSSDEREPEVDARTNLFVFINGSVGAFLVGIALIVDKALNHPSPGSRWPLYLIPLILAYVLYRAALGPTLDWGDAVRSSIDLHRLELYEKLGVRSPRSFSDERRLASKVTYALLYGDPLLPDELWRSPAGPNGPDEEPKKTCFPAWIRRRLVRNA